MTQGMVWLIPNETRVNSNFEPTNFSRIWLLKNPIHLKVSIKKGKKGHFKSKFSKPFYPLENLGPFCRDLFGRSTLIIIENLTTFFQATMAHCHDYS